MDAGLPATIGGAKQADRVTSLIFSGRAVAGAEAWMARSSRAIMVKGWGIAPGAVLAAPRAEVFCFFFSKKKRLLFV